MTYLFADFGTDFIELFNFGNFIMMWQDEMNLDHCRPPYLGEIILGTDKTIFFYNGIDNIIDMFIKINRRDHQYIAHGA